MKVKFEIQTTFENIACANYVLNQALNNLEEREDARRLLKISKTEVKQARRFANSVVKSFGKKVKQFNS